MHPIQGFRFLTALAGVSLVIGSGVAVAHTRHSHAVMLAEFNDAADAIDLTEEETAPRLATLQMR